MIKKRVQEDSITATWTRNQSTALPLATLALTEILLHLNVTYNVVAPSSPEGAWLQGPASLGF